MGGGASLASLPDSVILNEYEGYHTKSAKLNIHIILHRLHAIKTDISVILIKNVYICLFNKSEYELTESKMNYYLVC